MQPTATARVDVRLLHQGIWAAPAGLTREVAASATLRGAQALLTLLLSLAAANLLGAAEYGRYALAFALASLLAVPAGLGLPLLAVREVAARAHGDPARLRALACGGPWLILAAGLGLVALAAAPLLLAPAGWGLAEDRGLLLAAVALAGPYALLRWYGGWLQGLGRTVWAQLGDGVLRPGMVLAGLGLLAMHELDGAGVFALQAAAIAAAALLLARRLRREALPTLTAGVDAGGPAAADARGWLAVGMPLMAAGTLAILQQTADLALLAVLAGPADTGVYHAAARLAQLGALVLVAANVVVAPRVAAHAAAGERARLQALLTASARLTTAVALAATLAAALLGAWLLAHLGPGFAAGAPALTVLALAQLCNVACGSVAVALSMTGHQRDVLQGVLLGALVNLGLNAALIPGFGMLGAALATLASTVAWNGLLAWRVRRRLGVDPTVLGRARVGEAG